MSACSVKLDSYQLSFTFTLENFEAMMAFYEPEQSLESARMSHYQDPDVCYTIRVFPNGNSQETRGNVGVFLAMYADQSTQRRVRYTIKLMNKESGVYFTKSLKCFTLNCDTSPDWGYARFRSHEEVEEYLNSCGPHFVVVMDVEAWPGGTQLVHNEVHQFGRALKEKLFELVDGEARQGTSCDVTIRVKFPEDAGVFYGSRLLLSAVSPVFKTAFSNPRVKESESKEYVIPDFRASVVQLFLDTVHSGELRGSDRLDTCVDMLAFCEKYQVIALKALYEAALIDKIAVGTVCRLLYAADTHNANELRHMCNAFVLKHRDQVFLSEDWPDLKRSRPNVPADILESFM